MQEINYTEPGGAPVPQLGLTGVPLSEFPDVNTSNQRGSALADFLKRPFEATELLRAQFR